MSVRQCVYYLQTRGDGFDSDNRFEDQYLAGLVCRRCTRILVTTWPRPLDVKVWNGSMAQMRATFGVVFTSGAIIARGDFVEWIAPFIGPLAIGRVFLRGGEEAAEFCTCYGPKHLRVFGGVHRGKSCEACGRGPGYTWGGDDQAFVLEKDVVGKAWQTERGGFVVSEEVRKALDPKRFPDLKAERVMVVASEEEGWRRLA